MTVIVRNGADISKISALSNLSILENMRAAGLSEPEAPCGGNGTCLKCTVTVTGKIHSVDTGELRDAAQEKVLACRWQPAGDLEITVKDSSGMNVVADSRVSLCGGGKGLGAAFDIGTTTVAGFLYDLESGKMLSSTGERNAQRAYGADVISRICACSEGKLEELTRCICRQINGMEQKLCDAAEKNARDIRVISIAGNTVMEHIFAGLNPESIGVAPFEPQSLFGYSLTEGASFDMINAGGLENVWLSPCVAGYVGGDITAGLLATDADKAEGLRLFIDIGTNGEMALGTKDGYVCCATAAGPAFEGAEISCGMGGTTGAIDKVFIRDGDVGIHVIGETEATGICGSGLIDAVAVLLDLEVITEAGRLVEADEAPEKVRDRIFTDSEGHRAFRLSRDVYLHAQDVREVQLAKAAIRAGAETLLQLRDKTADDISELVIAGGFGSYMDKNSALRIGLLPRVDSELIRHAGNAAGAGASIAIEQTGRSHLADMNAECTYLELSSSHEFMDNYVEYMAFDE